MKNRTVYPKLNEPFVKELIKILKGQPKWFDMSTWGVRSSLDNPAFTPHDIKVRKRDCGTVCCLAGTIGVLTKKASWHSYGLKLNYGVNSWHTLTAEELGVDVSTALALIYRGSWPEPICNPSPSVSDTDGVLMLLNLLLKDKPLTTENLPLKVQRLYSA